MTEEGTRVVIALVLPALTAGLGIYVSSRPLTGLDRAAIVLRRGLRPAVFFTRCGYWPALTAVGAAVFVAEYFVRGGVAFAVALGAMQLLSQGAVNVFKETFKRKRPDDWLFHQELGFSFPSGHAATGVTFFGGVAVFLWSMPVPHVVTVVPAIFIVGLPWSRIALSAHYATDVLGGLLLGAAALSLLLALYALSPFL